jgi:hypothetical protein
MKCKCGHPHDEHATCPIDDESKTYCYTCSCEWYEPIEPPPSEDVTP